MRLPYNGCLLLSVAALLVIVLEKPHYFLNARNGSRHELGARQNANQKEGIMAKQEVRVCGKVIGYVEFVRLGELWRAVVFGGPPYPAPMFGAKGFALEYVRRYGK